MRRFRVAVAQIAPTLGDLVKNLALHEKTTREAIAQSANLLIFPELSLTGYFLKDQVPSVALHPDAPAPQKIRDIHALICEAKERFGTLAALPFSTIMQQVAAYQGRTRLRRR